MRYRTRRVFRLGGICPPSSHGISEPWYSLRSLPIWAFAYGAITLYGGAFQLTSASPLRGLAGAHHIPTLFRERVRTGLCRFPSPVLTASRLLSFPPGTKMFQFPGFPLPAGSLREASLTHSGIPGSTAACTSPGLIAACHALLRLPSQAIHHLALACMQPILLRQHLWGIIGKHEKLPYPQSPRRWLGNIILVLFTC